MNWLGVAWLAPSALGVALAGALGVLAAHLLARHRPPRAPLPTARFVPAARPASATRVAPPSDPLLLALRVLALLLAGAAFARPVRLPPRGSVARVVAVERPRDATSVEETRAAARALVRDGDRVILFDSVAHAPLVGEAARVALDGLTPSASHAALTPALLAAMRAGAALSRGADSVELAIVSPLGAGEADAATAAARAGWPGRVRVVRVAARERVQARPDRVTLRAASDDPLAATLGLAGLLGAAEASVRVVRDAPAAADTAWVRADSGRVLVHWPVDAVRAGWARRGAVDTSGAVVSGGATIVATFERRARPPDGWVVARFVDGEAAATERRIGAGCVRDVAVALPAGDAPLRAPMQRLARELVSPCAEPGGPAEPTGLSGDSLASLLAGRGALAPSRRLGIAGADERRSTLAPWLLAAAIGALLLEMLVRRTRPAVEEA